MPKDVLITPASAKVEFKDVSSNIDGLIQLDASDNLSITSPNGVLNLGASGNVYIGDGTNSSDVIFEQNGAIRALTGKTLTIGQSDSNVTVTGSVINIANPFIGTSGQYGRILNTDVYHGVILRGSTNASGTITAGNTMEFVEFGGVWRFKAINGTTMTTALDMSTSTATFLGSVSGTQLISTVATGTAPLSVTSTTAVTNLNADLLDGNHASAFAISGHTHNYLPTSGASTYSMTAGSIINTATQDATLQVFQPTANADAFMQFHISNDFALGFGLDGTTNDLSVGGWSMGAVKYRIWHAGNQATLFTSPAFTGTPTAPTASQAINNTQIATTAYVRTAVSGIVGGASYQTTAPSSPTVGQIWVDSDEVVTSLNSNDFLLKSGGTMTGNLVVNGTFSAEQFMIVSLSDETIAITTGTAKLTWRAPHAMTLTQIPRASLSTASTSGLVTVDINEGGVSVLGANKLSIDANEKTSTTAATATTLADTAIADDAEITFDIDAAGTGAKGLKVIIYYKRA